MGGNKVSNKGFEVHFYTPTEELCEVVLPKGKGIVSVQMCSLKFDLETKILTIPATAKCRELELKLPRKVVKQHFEHLAELSGMREEEVDDYRDSNDFASYDGKQNEECYFVDTDK